MTVIVVRDDADTARFDNASDRWTVTDADGRSEVANVVVDTRRSTDPTIAIHGTPNYFRTPGPDVARQTRFVNRCLDLLTRSGSARIEARSRIVLHRWPARPLASRFYLTGAAPGDDVFEGPAMLILGEREVAVHARLAGYLDPIDGQYHWRGTISGEFPADVKSGRAAGFSTDGHRVSARIAERTPWGNYTIVGVGRLPFC